MNNVYVSKNKLRRLLSNIVNSKELHLIALQPSNHVWLFLPCFSFDVRDPFLAFAESEGEEMFHDAVDDLDFKDADER